MDIKKAIVNPHTLNSDQLTLFHKVDEFLKSDKLSFTISGYAGTGKSYVCNYIIKELLKSKRVAVTAPTHKAVRVIENFTKKKGFTLHSLHGLRPNYSLDDFNIDNIKYESIGNSKFQNFDVIFIDEASMINEGLKKFNDTRSKQFKTKLIYLGDPLQLLPVREHKLSETFTNVDQGYTLTDIIRQHSDNSLTELLAILRDDVLNNKFNFYNYTAKNREDINEKGGYKLHNLKSFKDEVISYFTSPEFKKNLNYCRYAAYTNESVDLWNKFIRTTLFPTSDIIVEGDILTGYKTIVNSNYAPIILNANDYKVIKVIKRLSDEGFGTYACTLLDLINNTKVKVSIVDHEDDTFAIYYNKLNSLHRNAHTTYGNNRGLAYKKYFQFKDFHLCMINFDLKDHPTALARGFVKKELSYGYALTTHKLQGSTVDNIFIDGLDICFYNSNPKNPRVNTVNNPNVISLRNRLLYTSISRARHIAHILLEL